MPVLQFAVVPLSVPEQSQFQGLLPLTAEAVPVEQRPVVGAELVATPWAEPHEPFSTNGVVKL